MFEDLRMTLQYWPIEKLLPYARNPRRNDQAVEKGAAWIREFGFRVPILAKSDGTISDGHLRLKCAQKLKMKEVPVLLTDDMSDVQIKAFRLSVNRFSELADWDEDFLKVELEELDYLDYDVDSLDFDILGDKDIDEADFPDLKSGDKEPFSQMSFVLHDSQAEIVNMALKKASGYGVSDALNQNKNGNLLSYICETFLNDN